MREIQLVASPAVLSQVRQTTWGSHQTQFQYLHTANLQRRSRWKIGSIAHLDKAPRKTDRDRDCVTGGNPSITDVLFSFFLSKSLSLISQSTSGSAAQCCTSLNAALCCLPTAQILSLCNLLYLKASRSLSTPYIFPAVLTVRD